MTGYLIQRAEPFGSYLERTPYDGSYSFLAGSSKHATVFSLAAAEDMVTRLTEMAYVREDSYHRREPEITALPAVLKVA